MAHENATPRPWKVDPAYLSEVQTCDDQTVSSCWSEHASGLEITVTGVLECSLEESVANAALIVEAVNAYDALRAEVARLEAENRDLLEALKPFAERGSNTATTQMVTLGSCQRARKAYDAAHVALFGVVSA